MMHLVWICMLLECEPRLYAEQNIYRNKYTADLISYLLSDSILLNVPKQILKICSTFIQPKLLSDYCVPDIVALH